VQYERLIFGQADQQLLNQQPVVEDDQLGNRGHLELLVGKIWIVDRCDPVLIPILKYATQFLTGHCDPAWYHQGRVAEIDEADFPATLDAPPAAQVGRQAGLSSVRHPGVGRRSHMLHCSCP
jgi:hypothetical protein